MTQASDINPFAGGAAPDINPFAVAAPPKPQPVPPAKSKPQPRKKGAVDRIARRKVINQVSSREVRSRGIDGVLEDWIEIAGLYLALGVTVAVPPVIGLAMSINNSWDRIAQSRVAQWLNLAPEQVDQADSSSGGIGFEPLKIEAPYFLDESPPGSYDFTLINPETDSVHVDVPAACAGRVTESGEQGAYGNAIALLCEDGVELFMAHFADLYVRKGDVIQKGQALGQQGSTGNSTGEHVHLEVTIPGHAMGDRSVTRPYVEDVLFPFWKAGQKAAGFSVEIYKNWIAEQESGNNYSSVNPDSGALGKYQFMPDTMKSNALVCPGVQYSPTPDEFLRTPKLQEKIMDCYLSTALETIQKKTDDPLTQCRMMASHHYSGNPDLYDNAKPQFYGGSEYPSIADYTLSVCEEIL
ncbi:MAG: peptidoglycan DD-metalloendopeptidase family protein [Leptolyngbyaceae cyanobacterium]